MNRLVKEQPRASMFLEPGTTVPLTVSTLSAFPFDEGDLSSNIFARRVTSSQCRRRKRPLAFAGGDNRGRALFSSEYDDDSKYFEDYEESDDEVNLTASSQSGIARNNGIEMDSDFEKLETLDDLLLDLENDLETLLDDDGDDDVELDENDFIDDDNTNVDDLLSLLEEAASDTDNLAFESRGDNKVVGSSADSAIKDDRKYEFDEDEDDSFLFSSDLERALLDGVVPVSAGVGSECLPGDWGFDPLNLAEKDLVLKAQYSLLQALPGAEKEDPPPPRPSALILRDYREAEIRHGRLAMLAAVFWPLQEMLDRLLLDVDQFGPLIYGQITLPYFPLLMTLIMMLLGYLDIYAKAIKEADGIGDAFLPGDCFWDPLKILQGAPPSMARNMQERELFNGRVAMLAFAAFLFEELTTGLPLIEVDGNELLFVPAYQVPYIQEFLDAQFSFYS